MLQNLEDGYTRQQHSNLMIGLSEIKRIVYELKEIEAFIQCKLYHYDLVIIDSTTLQNRRNFSEWNKFKRFNIHVFSLDLDLRIYDFRNDILTQKR
jgi:hypothetical protein